MPHRQDDVRPLGGLVVEGVDLRDDVGQRHARSGAMDHPQPLVLRGGRQLGHTDVKKAGARHQLLIYGQAPEMGRGQRERS